MPDPVTVDHGGLSVTTNTASEADLRAELERPAPGTEPLAAPETPEGTPADAAAPVRDEKGRFLKRDAAAPSAGSPPPAEATPDAPPPPAEPAPSDGKPRHDPIARMKLAVERQAAAERRAAALEQELARLRPPVTAPVTLLPGYPPTPRPAPGGDEPQFEQFAQEPDPYTAYVQAWARWDHARLLEARFAQYEAQQAAKAQQTAFEQRIAAGAQKFPDWQEALTAADTLGLQVSAVMQQAITSSAHAPDVVHYLATHPEECIQLAEESESDTSADAAKWMRRLLESRLGPPAAASNGAGTAARPAISTAKPPVKPVGSSPVVSDAPPGEDASLADHARYWNRRLKVPGTT